MLWLSGYSNYRLREVHPEATAVPIGVNLS
jgi:hypothetical protein